MAVPVYKFGEFQLDCDRFELKCGGMALRVERKPMELLILLASRQGRLVTREEIAQRLWSSVVFVDTEHGINTAIRKLRHLLRDDADEPKFIQTVKGMGYRFIAPIVTIEDSHSELSAPGAVTEDSPAADGDPASEGGQPQAKELPKKSLGMEIFGVGRFVALVVLFVGMGIGARRIKGLLQRDPNTPIGSLAVIPLENLSGDSSQEYFADGMTDELITALAKDSTLRITSRTSVMQYKGAHRPLPEIARALHVDAILEGSISRADGQIHMTLQLIRADTDTHLWAESYDRDNKNVSALADEAARAIAADLHRAIASPSAAHTTTPEAHDAYLRGRYFHEKREVDKSAAYFQQAVSRDPSWSQAYSGLSAAIQSEGVFGILSPEETVAKGEEAARHAIDLDPQNGEAYSTLGATQATFEWRWEEAEANLRRGIALSPNSPEAEFYYVIYLDAVNRPGEAVTHMRKALALDPGSFLFNRHLGSTLYYARQYDEALVHLTQAAEMEPGKLDFVQGWVSQIYEMKGMRNEAVEYDAAAIHARDPAGADRLRAIYRLHGWNAYWEERQKGMLPHENDLCAPYDIGVNYIRLGKADLAFPYFNRAVDQKCWAATWMMVHRLLDKIRIDRRYNELLRRMNLPY